MNKTLFVMALRPTRLDYLKMKNNTCIPANYIKPHLGDLLLKNIGEEYARDLMILKNLN